MSYKSIKSIYRHETLDDTTRVLAPDLGQKLPFAPPEPTFVPVVSQARLTAIAYLEKKISTIEAQLLAISLSQGPAQNAGNALRGWRSRTMSWDNWKTSQGQFEMQSTATSRTVTANPNADEDELSAELVTTLQQLDDLVEGSMRMRRLQELQFLREEKLCTTQIQLNHHNSGSNRTWLMVNDIDWNHENQSGLEEVAPSTDYYNAGVLGFAPRLRPKRAWETGGLASYSGAKSGLKAQWRFFRNDLRKGNRFLAVFRSWHVQFFAMILSLVTFFAVGIVASTSTFSPIFLQSYFVIAIVWTLSSSCVVFFLVQLFGGDTKDAVAAFLAAVGLWLVVIQESPCPTTTNICLHLLTANRLGRLKRMVSWLRCLRIIRKTREFNVFRMSSSVEQPYEPTCDKA